MSIIKNELEIEFKGILEQQTLVFIIKHVLS